MADTQKSFFDKAQAWWETDNAKAIATIIAVLTHSTAVVAWNYASNRDVAFQEDEQQMEEDMAENSGEESNGESMEEGMMEENSDSDSMAMEEMEDSTGQGSSEQQAEPAVGGIQDVATLPNTESNGSYDYTVMEGDTVYSISQNVCGNDSYYIANKYRNYLRAGSVVKVNCN